MTRDCMLTGARQHDCGRLVVVASLDMCLDRYLIPPPSCLRVDFGRLTQHTLPGYFIAGCFIVASGRIGAVYHIGFPVVGRASFGIWGSLWPVFNRAAMVRAMVVFCFSRFAGDQISDRCRPASGTVSRATLAAGASMS